MINIKAVMSVKGLLFVMVILWQSGLSANESLTSDVSISEISVNKVAMREVDTEMKEIQEQLIQLEVVKLTDNSGLSYIGGKVRPADLELYLAQMKLILADDFDIYRQHQGKRDHNTFHMTLINPYEYQSLKQEISIGETVAVSLRGLGQVKQGDKRTFFVVAKSQEAQKFRQGLMLSNKDFHITLGFYPSDIYGVNKGVGSLID